MVEEAHGQISYNTLLGLMKLEFREIMGYITIMLITIGIILSILIPIMALTL